MRPGGAIERRRGRAAGRLARCAHATGPRRRLARRGRTGRAPRARPCARRGDRRGVQGRRAPRCSRHGLGRRCRPARPARREREGAAGSAHPRGVGMSRTTTAPRRADLLAQLSIPSRLHQDIEAEGEDVEITPEAVDLALYTLFCLANHAQSAVGSADSLATTEDETIADLSPDLSFDLENMRANAQAVRTSLRIIFRTLKDLAGGAK
ncbi:MAG: hypothetical protein DYH12_21830 [Sorangiineae bacterium PRO1]|nr:hypothetical protein [Sorangiineae bacterium PRO1]